MPHRRTYRPPADNHTAHIVILCVVFVLGLLTFVLWIHSVFIVACLIADAVIVLCLHGTCTSRFRCPECQTLMEESPTPAPNPDDPLYCRNCDIEWTSAP